jgi:hypothetical protein
MKDNFNNQFATQKLREDQVEETSVSSVVGVYQQKNRPKKDTYKKQKGERTTGGYVYKDLWENENIDEILTQADYDKAKVLLDKIKDKDHNLFMALLSLVTSETPHSYSDMEKKAGLAEDYSDLTGGIPHQSKTFSDEVGYEVEQITITEPLPDSSKDNLIKRLRDKGWNAKPNNAGGITATHYTGRMADSLQENYSRFKNETKTRGKADQFHQAIREVKRKVQDINKVFEYVNRLKNELNEGEHGLKYKRHTEAAIMKIKEMIGELNKNIRKFK